MDIIVPQDTNFNTNSDSATFHSQFPLRCPTCTRDYNFGIRRGKRDSPCEECRRAWRTNIRKKLHNANRRLPFTHKLRFGLWKDKDVVENVDLFKQFLDSVRKFKEKNGGLCDAIFFPEKRVRGALHFEGVARLDDGMVHALRVLWKKVRGEGRGTYSICLPKKSIEHCINYTSKGAVRCNDEIMVHPEGKSLIFRIGNVYRTCARRRGKKAKTNMDQKLSAL